MRKVLVTLALTLAAFAQGIAQQPAAADQQNVPANQKVIKDQAEYNAYMAALNLPATNQQDAAKKGAAMEAFVAQYPNSIVKTDALEQAMAAYEAASNQAKVLEISSKILELNPNNVRALAVSTFVERGQATPDKAAKIRADGEKGLTLLQTWAKPQDMSDTEYQNLKKSMTVIFAGAAGFGALQAKDFAAAEGYYQKSIAIDSNNLQDVYQMGVAGLESKPVDKKGFWYIAKAINLSKGNDAAVKQVTSYGKPKYRNYHGGDDGWDAIVAAAATQTAVPADFDIKPAATPAELACKVIQDYDPAKIAASDWEYVLQYRDTGAQCNKDAAEKVWQAVQAKQKNEKGEPVKIRLPGVKVISSAPDGKSLDVALTEENQTANKADIHIVMEKPMIKPPSAGTMTDVIGLFTSYTPNPFMFTMEQGELPAPPKPPVHRPVTRKKKK